MSQIKVAYVSYPYSGDVEGNSDRVRQIAQEIMAHRHDVVLIVPHWAFDALMGFPTGYETTFFADWELEIIARCDLVIVPPARDVSAGVIWETAFARRLGKPIYTPTDIINGKDKE